MTESELFVTRLEMACDPTIPTELRADCVMHPYYMARANLNGLIGIVSGTTEDDPIHRLAQDQLDAIYGFLTERGIGA